MEILILGAGQVGTELSELLTNDGHNITTKANKEHYYETDIDIQKSEEKIVYLKTLIETLTEIVDNLKWRHQTVGNIIRWRQFSSGE